MKAILHLMKYRMIATCREKTTLFWSIIFPFLLGSMFYMAFSNIAAEPGAVRAALVMRDQGPNAAALKSVLRIVSDTEESFLSVEEMTETEAKKQLRQGDISGVYYAGRESELLVAKNGMEESILQAVLNQFQRKAAFFADVRKEKPEKLAAAASAMLEDAGAACVKEKSLNGGKPDGVIQYYYALIAMSCLFAAYLGMGVAETLQANVGAVGARRMASAMGKGKMFLADGMTVFLIDALVNALLLCYLRYVLHLEIGENWPGMLLIVLLGCLLGITFGMWVGSMSRIGTGVKVGILTAWGLCSSFLSGLMIGGVKGFLEERLPLVNRINPASLITDALYSIAMYPDSARFVRDTVILGILALLFGDVACRKMRRVRYDSI